MRECRCAIGQTCHMHLYVADGHGNLSVPDPVALACGIDHIDGPPSKLAAVSMAWNPRKVLLGVFGGNAEVAHSACRKWARGDEEALKEAVSAACEWALRQRQSVSLKPGNYIRESLAKALREAARDAGPDRWKYGSAGRARVQRQARTAVHVNV